MKSYIVFFIRFSKYEREINAGVVLNIKHKNTLSAKTQERKHEY